MSGELQSIPARHGTATFVPKGQTLKIINTYGKQVVDTWIFGLHDAPDQGDDDEQAEAEEAMSKIEEEGSEKAETEKETDMVSDRGKGTEIVSEADKGGEENGDRDKDEKASGVDKGKEKANDPSPQPRQKSTWSSYIPSLRRNQNPQQSTDKQQASQKQGDDQSKGAKRTWASYFPSGQSYTSYLPSRDTLSAFVATHERDPTKSYAEQLYDFSKTPVGAASLSVATGSGTASSLYAAYSAYTKTAGSGDKKPMEYLSLAHTRDASKHLVPIESDVLYSNLRTPLATLVEDTTNAGHDALLPACDAAFYASLGVNKPEEHGSCAENLVLALSELNARAGLKGSKAIGTDVSVNTAPNPLHLFMHTTLDKDGEMEVKEPKGEKRGFVKFKAQTDIVVVMSACPCKEGVVNGGRCMAANFIVEDVKEPTTNSDKASTKPKPSQAAPKGPTPVQSSAPPERRRSARKLDRANSGQRRASSAESKPPMQRKPSAQRKPSEVPLPEGDDAVESEKPELPSARTSMPRKTSEQQGASSTSVQGQKETKNSANTNEPKPQRTATKPIEKRKPKKLERRKPSQSAQGTA